MLIILHTMQATIDNTTIAESNSTIEIEGNPYFPLESIDDNILSESNTEYTCPWKGEAQYFDIEIEGRTYEDAAWSYPAPKDSAIDRVGDDFSNYIAFDTGDVDIES
jgi:uncharacterized protein (DUF427 family)